MVMREEFLVAVPVRAAAEAKNAVDNKEQEIHGAHCQRQQQQREVGLALVFAAGHRVRAGWLCGEHGAAQVTAARRGSFGTTLGELAVREGGEEDVARPHAVLQGQVEVGVASAAHGGEQEGEVEAELGERTDYGGVVAEDEGSRARLRET